MIDESTVRRTLKEHLMKPDEVARIFNVTIKTVTKWARTGRLASRRTPGGQHRFSPRDVAAVLLDPPAEDAD
ncbi:helix-turn-helix domain-containing protein [Nonomuraea bangladeshensis]|uniref:helix-turn-helix domain-containing protein n=1 Tax=Nonomuraea bangladeshensis TaxID=404385 RepID=UPI003C2FF01C